MVLPVGTAGAAVERTQLAVRVIGGSAQVRAAAVIHMRGPAKAVIGVVVASPARIGLAHQRAARVVHGVDHVAAAVDGERLGLDQIECVAGIGPVRPAAVHGEQVAVGVVSNLSTEAGKVQYCLGTSASNGA
jgi:hypothetical protein